MLRAAATRENDRDRRDTDQTDPLPALESTTRSLPGVFRDTISAKSPLLLN